MPNRTSNGTPPGNRRHPRVRTRVLEAVRSVNGPVTPAHLAALTGLNPNTVRRELHELAAVGLLHHPTRGVYQTPGTLAGNPTAPTTGHRTRAYTAGTRTIRMPPVTELRGTVMTRPGTPVTVPVVYTDRDTTPVTGPVTVTYQGRNRWDITTAIPDPHTGHVLRAVRSLLTARTVTEGTSRWAATCPVTDPARTGRAGTIPWADSSRGMQRFQQAWDAAKARHQAGEPVVPYRRESLTGNPDLTFGIEIEAEHFDDYHALAAELVDAGFTEPAYRRRLGYIEAHNLPAETRMRNFLVVEDGSINRAHGAEVVTAVLTDTPEDWEKLVTVIELIRSHGGCATRACGGHLNIGLRSFGDDLRAYANLIGEYLRAEDTIVRLATDPGTGRHRNRGTGNYSRTNPPPPSTGYRSVLHMQRSNPHGSAVALNSADPGQPSNRAEFRIFDGVNAPVREGASIRERAEADVGVWQARLAVAAGMVRAALAATGENDGLSPVEAAHWNPEPVGTHRQRFHGRRLSGDDWEDYTRAFRSHLDRWFTDDTLKGFVTGLFFATRRYQHV